MQIAIAKRALEEPHCGDQAGCWQSGGRIALCIIDGLGHGKGAEQAAKAALGFVGRHHYEPLPEIFACCDEELRGTRGVTMGIAIVDLEGATLTYAGIGNTRAVVLGRETVRMTSRYGIVGGGYRTLAPETVTFVAGDLAILYTDGIQEVLDISHYDDALRADVGRLAETILQDWRRETDDAAVLVYRNGR